MKKFYFQYDNILEFKKKNEESIKNRLGAAFSELEDEKKRLSELENNKHACYDNMNKLMLHGTDIANLKVHDLFISKLNNKIELQTSSIYNCNSRIHQIRQELIKASKEVKVFEKLKEHHLVDHEYFEKKEEEKFIDQLVTYKYYQSK